MKRLGIILLLLLCLSIMAPAATAFDFPQPPSNNTSLLPSSNTTPSPPFQDALKPLVILKEPHPSNFIAAEYEVSTLVVDDGKIDKVVLVYSVNGGEWKEIEMQRENLLGDFESILRKFLSPPGDYGVYKAAIPAQAPGSEVWYKVIAYDSSGKQWESLRGYYVVPNLNGRKVLIYDPSMEAWFLKENLWALKEYLSQYDRYKVQEETIKKIIEKAELFDEYKNYVIQKHNWNILGEKYNILIATNPAEFDSLLDEFKPKVVVISNPWLYPWELSNVTQEKLIKYLRKVNGGLIVTHGGIYDQVIYESPDEKYPVGAIDHIGYTTDIYTLDKLRLSLALGLDFAPAVEYVKFLTADYLYEEKEEEAAMAIGSAPLFIPYIPFSGKMKSLKEHPILEGIPKEFQIQIPSAYKELGSNAYTAVGWQLMMPSEIARQSEENAKRAKKAGERVLEKIREFEKKYTGNAPQDSDIGVSYGVYTGIEVCEHKAEVKIKGEIKGKKPKPVELLQKAKFIEKLRIIKELGEIFLAKTIAVSTDNLAGIIVNDESYRKDGIRAVYFSFEVEAGTDQNSKKLLKNAVEWASNFNYKPVLNEIIILANDIDWKLKGEELKLDLEKAEFKVKRVTAQEFEKYKKKNLIIILGGPDAPQGVGNYVRQALTKDEQNEVREGKRTIFIKTDVWSKPQIVIILAGKNRNATADRVLKYLTSLDPFYQELLKKILALQ